MVAVGGLSEDQNTTHDAWFWPPWAPHINTFPLPPISVFCGAACAYCTNGINDKFGCVASVSGDNYVTASTIVDNGVSSSDAAHNNVLNQNNITHIPPNSLDILYMLCTWLAFITRDQPCCSGCVAPMGCVCVSSKCKHKQWPCRKLQYSYVR